ncbi:MAG: Do family serine endopeptidase [Cyclobacteriaceae bacterium]|nr:Do family serine endopeptidase [Cyclobacteriaceae bacterium]
MKRFGLLVIAAALGSALTLVTTGYFKKEAPGVRIEHVGTPLSNVALTRNENGEVVPLDFTEVAEKVTDAVVHIRSTSEGNFSKNRTPDPFEFFFGPDAPRQRGPSQSSGSGVIINADGYIVTNNHVVQGADVVDVTLHDNRSFKAEVVGTDPDTDLALVKIKEKNLPFLSFVDSDKSKVGEWVLAVGNPFNLNSTVTAGIISAKGRNINIINSGNPSESGTTAIESFIQTDAAINPGNSGGALVNMNGGLVGINTAIASPTGSYSGYGFAIPSNIVSKIVEDLLTYGTVQRGWLGIQVGSVNSDLVREEELSVNEGAFVSGFGDMDDKSAAKQAGIQRGDVIVKLDNTPIKTSSALIEYIGRKRPGDKVNVVVNRKGKEKVIPVVLKNREGSVGASKREERDAVSALGMELEALDPKVLKRLEISSGVRVKALGNGKVARYTEMREGYIITSIDNKPVNSPKEVNEIIRSKKPGELLIFSGIYEDFTREYSYVIRM